MKRFSKILTLILVLATVLTAFAVVALADASEDPNVVKTPVDFQISRLKTALLEAPGEPAQEKPDTAAVQP